MKRISDVIKELEALKAMHGDLPVVVEHDSCPHVDTEPLIEMSWAQGAIEGSTVESIVIT